MTEQDGPAEGATCTDGEDRGNWERGEQAHCPSSSCSTDMTDVTTSTRTDAHWRPTLSRNADDEAELVPLCIDAAPDSVLSPCRMPHKSSVQPTPSVELVRLSVMP